MQIQKFKYTQVTKWFPQKSEFKNAKKGLSKIFALESRFFVLTFMRDILSLAHIYIF
jgi:hypothetical protein